MALIPATTLAPPSLSFLSPPFLNYPLPHSSSLPQGPDDQRREESFCRSRSEYGTRTRRYRRGTYCTYILYYLFVNMIMIMRCNECTEIVCNALSCFFLLFFLLFIFSLFLLFIFSFSYFFHLFITFLECCTYVRCSRQPSRSRSRNTSSSYDETTTR